MKKIVMNILVINIIFQIILKDNLNSLAKNLKLIKENKRFF